MIRFEVITLSESILLDKSKAFAIRIINLYKYLCSSKSEFTLSKQLLRSGTSIGANIREANYSQSRKEFIAKMQISLKEAGETGYWLELLYETDYISETEYNSIAADCSELIKILISTLKTSKANT